MHIKAHCYYCNKGNLQIYKNGKVHTDSEEAYTYFQVRYLQFYFNDLADSNVSWNNKTYHFHMSINV
jgi:hypothetical protein